MEKRCIFFLDEGVFEMEGTCKGARIRTGWVDGYMIIFIRKRIVCDNSRIVHVEARQSEVLGTIDRDKSISMTAISSYSQLQQRKPELHPSCDFQSKHTKPTSLPPSS